MGNFIVDIEWKVKATLEVGGKKDIIKMVNRNVVFSAIVPKGEGTHSVCSLGLSPYKEVNIQTGEIKYLQNSFLFDEEGKWLSEPYEE